MTSRSSTRHRHRMRCGVGRCRARFTLRRHPDLYVRAIKCPVCGDTLRVRHVEAERQRELAKQTRCYCGGLPFPHREGSQRACKHHTLAGIPLTEEEERDVDGIWDTQRSGTRL